MPGHEQPSAMWGFEDAAKAVREILKIFDDVVARGGKLVNAYRWYQRDKAARALNVLRFKEGGFIPILEKIETGEFDDRYVYTINEMLGRTKRDVEQSIEMLDRLADLIRVQVGMDSAIKLERIISSDRSKGAVRHGLYEMANIYLMNGSKEQLMQQASHILKSIRLLNSDIIELHNVLLKDVAKRIAGERKVRKAGAAKKKAAKPATPS